MKPLVVAETDKLKMVAERQEESLHFRVGGTLDEDTNFSAVLEHLRSQLTMGQLKTLVFDLGKVKRLNSCGAREWIRFMEFIAALRIPYQFSVLSDVVVEYGSSVKNFLGSPAAVLAVELPYYCDGCDARVTKVITKQQIPPQSSDDEFELPPVECEKCGGNLEFDGASAEAFLGLLG